MRRLLAPVLLAFAVAPHLVAQSAASPSARLVALVMPEERQALAMEFMLAISPLPGSAKAVPCGGKQAREKMRPFFTRLYASTLTADELAAATAFFSTTEGKAALRIQRENDARLFELAKAGQQVGDENPHYPADVQAAIDRFTQTSAGAKFYVAPVEESPEAKEGLRTISDNIVQACLLDAAKKK